MLPTGLLICCTGPFWSGSLCLFGFCLPSLRCLISALTQAGKGDLLFRFASSVQSCCGEGGALPTDILCVASTPRVPAALGLPRTGVSVLSPSTLFRLPAVLYGAGPALSAVPVFGSSTKARIWLRLCVVSSPASAVQAARGPGALFPGCGEPFPSAVSGPGSQRLARTLPRCGGPFPSAAPAHAAGRVSGVL